MISAGLQHLRGKYFVIGSRNKNIIGSCEYVNRIRMHIGGRKYATYFCVILRYSTMYHATKQLSYTHPAEFEPGTFHILASEPSLRGKKFRGFFQDMYKRVQSSQV